MDVYGNSTSDHVFHIDDLLDFSNDQIFSSASTPDDSLPPPPPPLLDVSVLPQLPSASHEFANDLYFPSDDVAELEWLSRFADDSFADDIPANSLTNTANVRPDGAFSGKPKVKRSRSVVPPSASRHGGDPAAMDGIARRCTHCASEKTPQWRTGPMGPKTLCNACGVRYKSGRLVPEYRPAASPTFVLTQHSNSHRKVMELRRQKEVRQRQPEQMYGHHHRSQQHDFEVC